MSERDSWPEAPELDEPPESGEPAEEAVADEEVPEAAPETGSLQLRAINYSPLLNQVWPA